MGGSDNNEDNVAEGESNPVSSLYESHCPNHKTGVKFLPLGGSTRPHPGLC